MSPLKTIIYGAFRNLSASPLKSLLALTGIITGVGSVIALLAGTTMIREQALSAFSEMGTDAISIIVVKNPSETHKKPVTFETLQKLPDIFPEINQAASYISGPQATVVFNGKNSVAHVIGASPELASVTMLSLETGRFIHPLDHGEMVCVVGFSLAEKLRSSGHASIVGSQLRLDGRPLTIIGVLQRTESSSEFRPAQLSNGVVIPISTRYRLFERDTGTLITILSTHNTPQDVKKKIESYFIQEDYRRINVRCADDLLNLRSQQDGLLIQLLCILGATSLIVGSVSVMNIMLASVTERTQEIGIRRALGATRQAILLQFMLESIILCLIGGSLGIAIGTLMSLAIAIIFNLPFMIPMLAFWAGCGASFGAGLCAGTYPAIRAARLNPAVAINTR
ncbi:ABC transporter permease [Desulfovibrio psychrotolerans]|uniref:ABC transporter permease n=1 Tax=Desulfovibrio psychrotolerans TaxID=415242 RepID=UPI00157BB075|nr:ABC transporter permease [Desulfovibrio psychrotolerans]